MIKNYFFSLLAGVSALTVSASDFYIVEATVPNPPTVLAVDKSFDLKIKVQNIDPSGSGEINTFDVVFTPEGGSPVTVPVALEEPLPSKKTDLTVKGLKCDVLGSEVNATLTIDNINGGDRPNKAFPAEMTFMSCEKVFDHGVVVEEGTGTWCKFCNDAMIGMEYCYEEYKEKGFIGFSFHITDEFGAQFQQEFPGYSAGKPNGYWNRDYNTVIKPNKNGLEAYYLQQHANPSVVGVEVYPDMASENAKTAEITTYVEFGAPVEGKSYKVSYMLTEDNLPGMQNSPTGSHPVVFNMVVRDGSIYKGVDVTEIPAEPEVGVSYKLSQTIDLSSLRDVKNGRIAVLLLDAETGMVVNATRQPLMGERWSGVCKAPVADEVEAPVEYYNLQGVRVSEPQSGLYIRRQGDRVEKIVKR